MRSRFSCALRLLAWAVLGLGLLQFQPTEAYAQLNIQIGGSEAEFKARLTRSGYDRIETVKIGMASSVFRACKGGRLFSIKFEWTGNVEEKVVGNCREPIDEVRLRDMLRQRGYERIFVAPTSNGFAVTACLAGNRYAIETDAFGEERSNRRDGRCQRNMTPRDVTAMLEESGYDRIEIGEVRRAEYVILACRDRDRYRITVQVTGQITETVRTGRCRDRLSSEELVAELESAGLTRINVVETFRRRYVAEACRGNNRVRVVAGPWGGIEEETVIGECRTVVTRDAVISSMRDNGFTNVSVLSEGRTFVARGCRDDRYLEVTLSQWGELLNRNDMGSCSAPRINELAETLRSRGLDRLQFYVEACEGDRRVRIGFDEFANRTGRTVLGRDGC